MPKIYGLWLPPIDSSSKDGWARRRDGTVLHSTYPQAVAAEKPVYGNCGEVREIGIDGKPVEGKAVRPQSNKMIVPDQNK